MNMKSTPCSKACPAIVVAAPASGQGKTTITAALVRWLVRQGKRVQVFKLGPDYLDPQVLAQASGQNVVQLDLWMAGEAWVQHQLYQAARASDVIIIEGVMGLFDGTPSTASFAKRFNLPLMLVIDVKGMAQTAAAVAAGLVNFDPALKVIGLIANRCGSQRHRELIELALPEHLKLLAVLPRDEQLTLPERHLGLVQPQEIAATLEERLNAGADALEASGIHPLVEQLVGIEETVSTTFVAPSIVAEAQGALLKGLKGLKGLKVGIARDAAFSFIYQANLDFFATQGATIVFFSPITDAELPSNISALWLPGGYPELHAKALSENASMLASIREHYEANKPILAECGGFLYVLEQLIDLEGQAYPLLGLLPGKGAMKGKRGCQGMQTACLPEGEIRGHAHHRSRTMDTPVPLSYAKRQKHRAPGEAIFRSKNLTATFLHLFFPSNTLASAALFQESLFREDSCSQEGVEVLRC